MNKAFLAIGISLTLASCTMMPHSSTQDITVIGVNDLHGNLLPTSFRIPDPKDRSKTVTVKAGGIDTIGGVLASVRAENPNTVFVGVGDMTGASPLVSALLRDEPTLQALNELDMKVNVVGNHEFDYGFKELQRYQKGGCDSNEPSRACKFNTYSGTTFPYIAANVIDTTTNQPAFPAYHMVQVGKAKIAFVGAVLQDTPSVVIPSGVEGLRFENEVTAINRVMPEIKAQKPDAIIALVHQGGYSKDAFDVMDCKTLSGEIVDIAKGLDAEIGAVMTGHTHKGYNCLVPDPTGKDRPVIQGDAYGHLLQRLDLKVDLAAHKLLAIRASNIYVDSEKLPKDPKMTALVQKAKAITEPLTSQPIATLGTDQLTRATNSAGESSLGNIVADSQLAAAQKQGAVIAFMNPGGIRADLPVNVTSGRTVTYGDTFTVQPFGNIMQTITLTGAQIKGVLEQQFDNPSAGQNRILAVSRGFSYTWDNNAAKGMRISNITLNGQAIDPMGTYRVTMNQFLAEGGDGFTVFKQGTERTGGVIDLDAFGQYLKSTPIETPVLDRITRLN